MTSTNLTILGSALLICAAILLASLDALDDMPRTALIILHAALGMISLVAATIRAGGERRR